jgi:hypothetical protein
MDKKTATKLDPQMKDTYDRIMGLSHPTTPETPPSQASPQQQESKPDIPQVTPMPLPSSTPPPSSPPKPKTISALSTKPRPHMTGIAVGDVVIPKSKRSLLHLVIEGGILVGVLIVGLILAVLLKEFGIQF